MIKRVLLIEDQPHENRRAIRKLEEAGYDVIRAVGPETAKRRLRENPDIDLVILDCIMPPECYTEEETNEGTTTGITLYMDALQTREIPVAIWTVLGEIPRPAGASVPSGWDKMIILRTRKKTESDELVDLVHRCEAILAGRGGKG